MIDDSNEFLTPQEVETLRKCDILTSEAKITESNDDDLPDADGIEEEEDEADEDEDLDEEEVDIQHASEVDPQLINLKQEIPLTNVGKVSKDEDNKESISPSRVKTASSKRKKKRRNGEGLLVPGYTDTKNMW